MSRLLPALFLLVVAPLLLLAQPTPPPPATALSHMAWQEDDLVMDFRDSVGYEVDLVATDSTEVVIRLTGLRAEGSELSRTLDGPDGLQAIVSPGLSDGSTRLTVRAPRRIGYSIHRDPYLNRLTLYTFDWNELGYAEAQFHQGLLALEEGVTDQGEELLSLASATGERRATSVLGGYYARRGDDSLASFYLRAPTTAGDYAALADVQNRTGDATSAEVSRTRSRELLGDEAAARRSDDDRGDREPDRFATGDRPDGALRGANEWYLLGAGLLAILFIGALVAVFARRRSGPSSSVVTAATPPPPANVPPSSVPSPGYRVVDRPTASESDRSNIAFVAGSSPGTEADRWVADPLEHPRPDDRHAGFTPSEPEMPRRWMEQQSPTAGSTESRESTSARPAPDESGGSRSVPASEPTRLAPPDETTIDAARRMNMSRDNVELRRRMDARSRDEEGDQG